MNAVGTPRRGLIWLVFGLAFLGTSVVPLPLPVTTSCVIHLPSSNFTLPTVMNPAVLK